MHRSAVVLKKPDGFYLWWPKNQDWPLVLTPEIYEIQKNLSVEKALGPIQTHFAKDGIDIHQLHHASAFRELLFKERVPLFFCQTTSHHQNLLHLGF